MKYITDYQLDITRGFQCKVNGKTFNCTFNLNSCNKQYFISNILSVADAMEIPRQEFLGIFNSSYISNSIYCDSKQKCYDLCQYIVDSYFKPTDVSKETKECSEKSRKHLVKYYNPTTKTVFFPDNSFELYKWNNEGQWFWRNTSIGSQVLYEQFKLTQNQVLNICNNLNLLAFFIANVLIFESTVDAIKFTDYLIETYIIKKEKTYDTNRLRKERTSLSRGTKPAGSIIHGRRSKASVRCRHIEHKARIGC